MAKNAYHINDVCLLLDQAKADEAAVNLKAWTSDGRVIDYSGWLVKGAAGEVDSIAWLTRQMARSARCRTFIFSTF